MGDENHRRALEQETSFKASLKELERMERLCRTAPSFPEMEQRSLAQKWMDGPTAAHVREEVHVPKNYAYMTFTTGTSAFQTPVGVVYEELEGRRQAAAEVFRRLPLSKGDKILVTYAPLVSVFSRGALEEAKLRPVFLERSSREALLLAWCREDVTVTVGESSFLRAALEDAFRLGIGGLLPKRMILLAAGTPLEPQLSEILEGQKGWELHDLYGCQEFGWLAFDGILLRPDIRLIEHPKEPDVVYPAVGALVVGDSFRKGSHCLNSEGRLVTHAPAEGGVSWETRILSCRVENVLTARRAAKSILRIKSRIVRVSENFVPGGKTRVKLIPDARQEQGIILEGPEATMLLDSLVEAQKNYQKNPKRDGTWVKR